jgi:hypothetical protein
MDNQKKILGFILIFLGIIFLLENLSVIRLDFLILWPILIILGGAGFWLGYAINRKLTSFIIPGTILISYGALFLHCTIFGWDRMAALWPVFLMGPGVGFYLLYLLGGKNKILLWPAGILIILSALFFLRYIEYLRYWPVLLIIGGVILILKKNKGTAVTEDKQAEESI